MKYSHLICRKVLLSWILLLGNIPVNAAVVYTYTGNNYNYLDSDTDPNIYDSSMHLTITFTTDNLITDFNGDITASVNSFSSFDGVNLLTENNSYNYYFAIHTDSAGNLLEWDFFADTATDFDEEGDRSTFVTSKYIIGLGSEEYAFTEECYLYTLGNCYGVHYYDAAVNNDPGTWAVVPVPPAIWLFGSGMLGLFGITRRKKAA